MEDWRERNFQNRTLYHADNLDILRGMNSGTIHLIATDPPFNKNRDFHATPDSLAKGARFVDRWRWDEDAHHEWVNSIKDNWPKVRAVIEAAIVACGKDMAAFLCWLGVRLLEMHRILRDDGSIYLHFDHTAHAWVKALMDAVFGRNNFRNTISWQRNDGRGKGSQFGSRKWGSNTDALLLYAKTDLAKLRPYRELSPEEIAAKFPHVDKDGRRYYTGIPIFCSRSMGPRPNLCYEWRGFRNPHPSGWRLSKETLEEEYAKGNVVIRDDGKLERRKYLEDYQGEPMDDFWNDIPRLSSGAESTGYPTQKPLALYQRMIEASSKPNDWVLDPFAGCATTPVAAERLGRRWVGIDIWDGAYQMVLDRLRAEGLVIRNISELPPGQQVLRIADVHYETEPPERSDDDDGETPVPNLRLRIQRPKEDWEKIGNRVIRAILERAQEANGLIGCAGCGRVLETEFMELDHLQPKAEGGADHLLNRILLCRPCNGRKSNQLTMAGLRRQNIRDGWMKDRRAAEQFQQKAFLRASLVRDGWGQPSPLWDEIQALVAA